MPRKAAPPARTDVAKVKLTATDVTVKATKKPLVAKRTIHERRAAPPVPKGAPVSDASPSEPVKIGRAPRDPPSKRSKRRG